MKLTAKDEAKLKTLHPALVKVVREAARITSQPFMVGETSRSLEQQRKNVAKGVSKTLNSRHLIGRDGYAHAVDLWPLIDGKPCFKWFPYYAQRKMVKQAAKNVRVNIRTISWDGPHAELLRSEYP